MENNREYDEIEMTIKSVIDYIDGDIEENELRKKTTIVMGLETHLGKMFDIFVNFLKSIGFSEKAIYEEMVEMIECYEYINKEE